MVKDVNIAPVELTAGGGGKGEQRQAKLAKNKARLDAQRVKKAPDAASTEKKDGDKAALSKNAKRRGKDAGEEAKERKPKVKKERKPFKPQLSGANAMRLG